MLLFYSFLGELDAATFSVTTTANTGDGSLRAAISNANASAGPHEIHFAIPGDGPHVIAPLSRFDTIVQPVLIDGFSQPGSSSNTLTVGNDSVLKIVLDGSQAGFNVGLNLANMAEGSVVRGLSFVRWLVSGVVIRNGQAVEGCWFGVDPAGNPLGGTSGIIVQGNSSLIGGPGPAARNLISAHSALGIDIQFGKSNVVLNCYIGVDPSGTVAMGNTVGIGVGGEDTRIGLPATVTSAASVAEAESGYDVVVIGGNELGIRMFNAITTSARGSSLQNSYMGVGALGTNPVGNITGVLVTDTSNILIGGARTETQKFSNVFGFNVNNALCISNSSNVTVEDNYIGWDATGMLTVPNGAGLKIIDSINNWITGNWIANSTAGHGINIRNIGTTSFGNFIMGNGIADNFKLGIKYNIGSDFGDDPTPNDDPDTDGVPNFPVIRSAFVMGLEYSIDGSLRTKPNLGIRLEFFDNDVQDQSGFGEGQFPIGSTNLNTDANGVVEYQVRVPLRMDMGMPVMGRYITATATDLDEGSTSEFSSATAVQTVRTELSLTKTDSADPVIAGGSYSYTLIVSNAGPDSAPFVHVVDGLPEGVTVLTPPSGSGWDCLFPAFTSNSFVCLFQDLAPNSVAPPITVLVSAPNDGGVFTNTASAGTKLTTNLLDPPLEEENFEDNIANETTTVTSFTDVFLTKRDSPDPVPIGSNITYQVTVQNVGPSSAPNVVLTDTLPAGVQFVSASTPRGTCEHTNGVVTCNIGTLAGNPFPESITVTIVVRAIATGDQCNRATVTADVNSDPNNDEDTVCTTVTGEPVNQPPVAQCQDVTKQADETGTAIVTPEEVDNGSFDPDGDTITLTLDPTGPYDIGTTPYTLTVTDPLGAFSTCNGTITVTSVVTRVRADLAITKMADFDTVEIGSIYTYTITVTNNGPDTVPFVFVGDFLPPGVSLFGTSGDGWECFTDGLFGTDVLCRHGTLAPGSVTSNLTLIVVAPSQTGTITNLAQVAGSTSDDPTEPQGMVDDTNLLNNDSSPTTMVILPPPICTLAPSLATNVVGSSHSVTATVTRAGNPVSGVDVLFGILPGSANEFVGDTQTTDLNGRAVFTYTGTGGEGVDQVAATGIIGEETFGCEAIKVWILAPNQPPVARCRDVTKEADESGTATVTPEEVDDGSFDPDGEIVIRTLEPSGPFTIGETAYTLFLTDNDGGMANCGGSVTVTPRPTADLAVTKSSSPEFVIINESVVFTVTVTNLGPDTATNVRIIENTPGNVAVGGIPEFCQSGSEGFVCSMGDIPPNGSRQLVLNGGGFSIGVDSNTAAVVSDTFDPDSSNNRTSVVVTVTAEPSPVCELLPLVATNAVRTSHSTTVAVTRLGIPVAGTGVTFRVTSGPNSTGVAPQTKTTDASGQATFTYSGGGTPGTDTLEVTGDGFGCTATKVWISDTGKADVGVIKKAPRIVEAIPDSRKRFEFAYTIVVTNLGPSRATEVVVTDMLPDRTRKIFLVSPAELCTVDEAEDRVECRIPILEAREGVEIRIEVQVKGRNFKDGPGFQSVTNNVTVQSATEDPDLSNNSAEAETALGLVSDLSPRVAINPIGTPHIVVASLSTNSVEDTGPIQGATVFFHVVSGPNSNKFGQAVTDETGRGAVQYIGDGGVGTDTIIATGSVEGVTFEKRVIKTWVEPLTCSVLPQVDTNDLRQVHQLSVSVKKDGRPGRNLPVVITFLSGPHAGTFTNLQTDANGRAVLEYRNTGGEGRDGILVTAIDGEAETTCTATKEWVDTVRLISELRQRIDDLPLSDMEKDKLREFLSRARQFVRGGAFEAARGPLSAFFLQVQRLQKQGALDAATADSLIADAKTILSALRN